MSDLNLPTLPVSLPSAPTSGAHMDEAALRARIDKSGKAYESAFLSIMFGQMFEGVSAGSFGGGQGEDAFKSFLNDAMAKAMVKHGGIGLSSRLSAEMLKMQGLSKTPSAPAAAAAPAFKAPAQPTKLDIAA